MGNYTGMYIGEFSVHGPEVVKCELNEYKPNKFELIGRKLTGDANVPCNEISFM